MSTKCSKTFWVVPIRYWENKDPHEIQVEDGSESSNTSIYGFMALYGHAVYVEKLNVFETREGALAEANRREAKRASEMELGLDQIFDRFFAEN